MTESKNICRVCGGTELTLIKESDSKEKLDSGNFAITNFDYGKTGELQKCNSCGFIQCTDLQEVVKFYEDLEDKERKLQEQRLIKTIGRYKKTGKLLDIGAGSGIMIEAAMEKGYNCTGIEPSRWLQQRAVELNLPVLQGVFPHLEVKESFDIITLVDVIEHVIDPADLLKDINKQLAPDGIFLLVTPDVSSLAAKMLGYKWWHYRFAHIGYFNKKNLKLLLEKTGFTLIKMTRPSWYFTLRYLGIRFLSFLPKFLQFPLPKFLEKITIPVNLRDSLQVICKKNV